MLSFFAFIGSFVRLRLHGLFDLCTFSLKTLYLFTKRETYNSCFLRAAHDQVIQITFRVLPVFVCAFFLLGVVMSFALIEPMHRVGILVQYGDELLSFLIFNFIPLLVTLLYAVFSFPSQKRLLDFLEKNGGLRAMNAYGIGLSQYPAVSAVWAWFISLLLLCPLCAAALILGIVFCWLGIMDLSLTILFSAWQFILSPLVLFLYGVKILLYTFVLGNFSVAIYRANRSQKSSSTGGNYPVLVDLSVFYGSLMLLIFVFSVEAICLFLIHT